MLFHVTWQNRDASEQEMRRSLTVFAAWQPPPEARFLSFYGTVDGHGGVAIIEADSAQALARATAPWVPWLAFTVTPIVPMEEMAGIAAEAIAFRESVEGAA